MPDELARMIQSMVFDCPMPAKEIAKAVGKPYSTLLREINPHDHGSKLGIDTFARLIQLTGDTRPVQYLADRLGLEIIPKESA